jgi:hypothetical protein
MKQMWNPSRISRVLLIAMSLMLFGGTVQAAYPETPIWCSSIIIGA